MRAWPRRPPANARRLRRLGWLAALAAGAAAVVVAALAVRPETEGPASSPPITLQSSRLAGSHADVPSVTKTDQPAYGGEDVYRAHTPGAAATARKYARGVVHELGWQAGTDVWYGCAFYLPAGFYEAQEGQVDLMRWDNFVLDEHTTDRGGVVIYGPPEPGRAYMIRARLGGEQQALVGPFRISEGEWHWLEAHQRFATDSGSDVSELFLDGRLVGRSNERNWYGRPITSVRFGIVATGGRQSEPLDVLFARASISDSRIGPRAES